MFEDNPKLRGKGPNCEQCFPGVERENVEAWEVFQRYSNPWGMDSSGILSLCKICGVKDELETLEKVTYLIAEIERE